MYKDEPEWVDDSQNAISKGFIEYFKLIENPKQSEKTAHNLHGNFYYAWIPPKLLIEDASCFKKFVGRNAFSIYSAASEKQKKSILEIIKDLAHYRKFLNGIFVPQRGGVTINSDSLAALSTESPAEVENEDTSSSFSIPDSESGAENSSDST